MSTESHSEQAKNISMEQHNVDGSDPVLTKAEKDKVNYLIDLSKRVKFECPPSDYQWKPIVEPTIFKYKVREISFIVDPTPVSMATRNNSIPPKTEYNSPSVIKQNDINNIIMAASIPHKRMGVNIASLINYDAESFERERRRYNAGLEALNRRFSINENSQVPIPAIIPSQPLLNEDEQKRTHDPSMHKDMQHILKSIDVIVRYSTNVGRHYDAALRLAPIVDESSLWVAIARLDYKDAEERNLVADWNVNIDAVVHVMTRDVYVAKYTAMADRISEHVDRLTVASTGVVHHIIFKGSNYYNLINESPDFIVWVLDEHNYWNIPKYIAKKIQY
jgi:hypothetical protein